MKYEIVGGTLPAVICSLEQGQSIITEKGGMAWMSDSYEMKTNMEGGLFKSIKRKFSGESMFMTTYTNTQDTGEIAFTSSFPGSIKAVELGDGETIIAQKGALLAHEKSVEVSIHFNKKLSTGLFGGEGFVLQKITGPGVVFLEIDGSAVEYELQAGETMKVDTGNLAVMDSSVNYSIERVKGFKNMLFGGEGLFLTKLTGPGKVTLQTMPMANLMEEIIKRLPPAPKGNNTIDFN